jgi:hypothetical protein
MVGVGIIPGLSGSTAMVEFWFGARHGDRYIRRPAGAIVLTFDNDWENFEEHLLDSQNAADDLQEDSLTQLVPALLW